MQKAIKTVKMLPMLVALASVASTGALHAQEEPAPPSTQTETRGNAADESTAQRPAQQNALPLALPTLAPGDHSLVGADRPTTVVPQDLGRLLLQENQADKLKRPELPNAVQELVQQFQSEREAYIKAQAEARAALRIAKGDDRTAIRERLRAARERWLDQQRQLRDQLRDQLRELREKLRDARDEQLEDARDAGSRRGGRRGD
jgi:hypothetical protein